MLASALYCVVYHDRAQREGAPGLSYCWYVCEHVLLELKRRSPVKFDLAAATVDPQTPEYDPWPLVPYLEQLGVRYHMLSKPIIAMAKTSMDPKAGIRKSPCLGVITI